uniref:Ankyrin repeat protein n=1 Tax=Micromonas pusilla TaxID=38833 RepID=A0A7S0NIW1_MICPS
MGYIMGSHSPTRRSKEEKEQRKSAAKAKIRAIGMVQAAFKRAQQRQGAASPEAVNNGEEEPRLTWRERMAERAKEREGLATARGFDETARSSRSFRDPPSEPSSTQRQARKLEERAKVERRRKEEARARTRRDADRRARTSDPFEAELDRMSDAEAMGLLDDVPISDLDTDRDSDDDGARSRRTGAVATDEESNADDGLAPMERAMARAARARAATRGGDASSGGEAEARVASNAAAPLAPRHPPPPRTQTAPVPERRRGGDAEERAFAAEERARRAEAELADARRRIRELERRVTTAERRAEVAERRSAAGTGTGTGSGVASVGAPADPGLPQGPSWLAPSPAEALERTSREGTRIEVREEREEEPRVAAEATRRFDPPALEVFGRLDLSAVRSDVDDDAPPSRGTSRGDVSARALGGGDGAAVGATGDGSMRHEVSRLKKSAKQSLDKERAMVDQLNALRRARDASESRVRDLAKELQEAQMDKQAWGREEDALSRRVNTARGGGGYHDGGYAPRQEPSTPRFAPAAAPQRMAATPVVARVRGGDITSGSESDGGLTDASVSSARKHGEHPIFQKIRHGRVNEAAAMLSGDGGGAGVDPDVKDRFGNTPLIVAAQNNRKRISKMCVKAGVPLDAVNNMGNSALHYCYSYGYFELGEYLVSKGADPRVRNAEGKTPRDTLQPEQLRALAQVQHEVQEKLARRGSSRGRSGGIDIVSDSESEMASDSEVSDVEGGLESYRALYSARGR